MARPTGSAQAAPEAEAAPADPGRTGAARGLLAGALASLPVLLAVAPFGLVFGAVAKEAGLDLAQTMTMTALVIAGASQLATLQVLSDGAPALVAVLTGAIVNLRMAMYSASIALEWRGASLLSRATAALLLHDQSYALSIARYRRRPGEPLGAKLGFYFGVGLTTSIVWIGATYAGATLGRLLPAGMDISVVVPVTFIAIAAPMLRGPVDWAVAAGAAALAILFDWLPAGLGLAVGAVAGIAVGILLDRWSHRAKGPGGAAADGEGERR